MVKIKQIKKEHVKVKVSDLKDYALNNKIHPEKQIEEIKKSIIDAGYIVNICVDENLEILTWHGRKEALEGLQIKEIEVTKILWLSDKEKRIYRIRDNKISELWVDNEDNLKFELIDLENPDLNELCELSVQMDPEGVSDSFELPSNDKSKLCQMMFTITEDQRDEIEKAMETARILGAFVDTWNENKNGNAIARVAELFNSKNWED